MDLSRWVQSDPGRLDEVETRLSAIDSLKRKYGDSIAEILAFADAAQAELAFLESSSERCQELEKELAEAWEAWLRQAQKVSACGNALPATWNGGLKSSCRFEHG